MDLGVPSFWHKPSQIQQYILLFISVWPQQSGVADSVCRMCSPFSWSRLRRSRSWCHVMNGNPGQQVYHKGDRWCPFVEGIPESLKTLVLNALICNQSITSLARWWCSALRWVQRPEPCARSPLVKVVWRRNPPLGIWKSWKHWEKWWEMIYQLPGASQTNYVICIRFDTQKNDWIRGWALVFYNVDEHLYDTRPGTHKNITCLATHWDHAERKHTQQRLSKRRKRTEPKKKRGHRGDPTAKIHQQFHLWNQTNTRPCGHMDSAEMYVSKLRWPIASSTTDYWQHAQVYDRSTRNSCGWRVKADLAWFASILCALERKELHGSEERAAVSEPILISKCFQKPCQIKQRSKKKGQPKNKLKFASFHSHIDI